MHLKQYILGVDLEQEVTGICSLPQMQVLVVEEEEDMVQGMVQ